MRKRKGFLGAGLSTVLLVFVMLCLIVFAVLSLSTARTDLQMSRKIADRMTAYYEAQSRAYARIKTIDGILTTQYNKNSESGQKFADAVWMELQQEKDLTLIRREDEILCTFTQPIDDMQQIQVTLAIAAPVKENEPCYRITGWESTQREEWKADTGLPVLQKEDSQK